MAKKMKKFMSMALVLCMMASMLSVGAFAADGTVVETESSTVDGITTNVTTTTTTTTDENGNVTVNLKIESNSAGVNGAGETVTGNEVYEETVVTDSQGNELASDWELNGSEKKEWTEEDNGDGAQPEVDVSLIPGETTTGTAGVTSETVTNADGSVTTTTTTDRTVTAETSRVEVSVNESESGLVGDEASELKGLTPEYDETDGPRTDAAGKEHVFDRNYLSGQTMDRIEIDGVVFWLNDTDKTITNIYVPEGKELPEDFAYAVGQDVSGWYNGTNLDKKKIPSGSTYTNNVNISKIENWYKDGELIVDIPEGADFMYVGTGEHSKLWVGFVNVVYEKDPVTGETVRDADGNPVIKNLLSSDGTVIKVNGEEATKVTVTFSSGHKPWFEYDAESQKYLRFQYGDPQMDGWMDTQLAVDNVLVLRMELTDLGGTYKLVEIDTTGSGEGWFFTKGKYVPITWEKEKYNSEIRYYTADGEELVVSRGQTFVSVVTTTADVVIE